MYRHCVNALRTALSLRAPRVLLSSMFATEAESERRTSASFMSRKFESISLEPLCALPVASISPFLKALNSAWESICLKVTDSSFGLSPHQLGFGTNLHCVVSKDSILYGP